MLHAILRLDLAGTTLRRTPSNPHGHGSPSQLPPSTYSSGRQRQTARRRLGRRQRDEGDDRQPRRETTTSGQTKHRDRQQPAFCRPRRSSNTASGENVGCTHGATSQSFINRRGYQNGTIRNILLRRDVAPGAVFPAFVGQPKSKYPIEHGCVTTGEPVTESKFTTANVPAMYVNIQAVPSPYTRNAQRAATGTRAQHVAHGYHLRGVCVAPSDPSLGVGLARLGGLPQHILMERGYSFTATAGYKIVRNAKTSYATLPWTSKLR